MTLPLVIEPQAVESIIESIKDNDNILILDLCSEKQYQQIHIPGAVFVDYAHIVSSDKPTQGLLPDPDEFSQLINTLGITENTHVIAYDEEGGGKAARLIWTLHAMGHNKTSLLNGGIIAWYHEKHPISNKASFATPNNNNQQYTVDFAKQPVIANTEYIKNSLENPSTGILDARSVDEYNGKAKYAEKTGRIPGAKHFEWTRGMSPKTNQRLLDKETLQPMLDELGLTQDKEIIVYCQSHHRSALSYLMLKYLGYEKVRGYPGSWSEWGNRTDTPIEN